MAPTNCETVQKELEGNFSLKIDGERNLKKIHRIDLGTSSSILQRNIPQNKHSI